MKAVNYLLMLAGFYLLVSCGDGKVSDRVIEDTGNALLTLEVPHRIKPRIKQPIFR